MNQKYIILFLLLTNIIFSQTIVERKDISASYKFDKNLSEQVQKNEEERKMRLLKKSFLLAVENSAKQVYDEVIYELRDITTEGIPLYLRTYNQGGAHTIKTAELNTGGSLGLNINGENMTAGVWDEGSALQNHVEFSNNKISSYDGTTITSLHTTHVTGTIVAEGVWKGNINYPPGRSKGIAPAAKIIGADWDNDIQEIKKFGQEGYLVSNHSYGYAGYNPNSGYIIPRWFLGGYDVNSYNLDAISSMYPKYQLVFAAGNDRRDYNLINPDRQGYELITSYGNAKNVLTIGAVEEVLNYTAPTDVKIADFSNFGPTDDGRIKPNLVAKGVKVFSTSNRSTNSYISLSGTSMATPMITGAILLLQQYNKNLYGSYMNSATVRGVLQHTAREAGNYPGPDYQFGWGLADAEASAKIIAEKGKGSILEEKTLNNKNAYVREISVSGSEELCISISWTDLPFMEYNKGIINPNQDYLVNDLNVKVKDERGNIYYPWVLDKNYPTNPAKQGINKVDNFERINIPNASGKYTIIITHAGDLVGSYDHRDNVITGSQDYSLVITGKELKDLSETIIDGAEIGPNPAREELKVIVANAGNYEVYGLNGNMLSSGQLLEGVNTINISKLTQGMYLIKIITSSVEKKKFLVK